MIFIIDKITENLVTAIHMGWHDMGYHEKIILKHENQNRFQILKFHAVTKPDMSFYYQFNMFII